MGPYFVKRLDCQSSLEERGSHVRESMKTGIKGAVLSAGDLSCLSFGLFVIDHFLDFFLIALSSAAVDDAGMAGVVSSSCPLKALALFTVFTALISLDASALTRSLAVIDVAESPVAVEEIEVLPVSVRLGRPWSVLSVSGYSGGSRMAGAIR